MNNDALSKADAIFQRCGNKHGCFIDLYHRTRSAKIICGSESKLLSKIGLKISTIHATYVKSNTPWTFWHHVCPFFIQGRPKLKTPKWTYADAHTRTRTHFPCNI